MCKNFTPQGNHKRNYIFISIPTPFFFCSFPPLPYRFYLSYLSSVFIQYFSSSFLIAHYAPSLLNFHPIRVFSLLVPTSKSYDHFSFFCPLSPQVFRNFLCHTSLILPLVSGCFDSFPSFLLFCIFIPFTQLYIHLSAFCSFNLSTSSLAYSFLSLLLSVFFFSSSIPLVSCTLPFHPFYLQILPLVVLLLIIFYFPELFEIPRAVIIFFNLPLRQFFNLLLER
jgi:hypothetical protein